MIKITGKLLLSLVCMGLLLTTTAFAENRGGASTLTPMVGFHSFENGMELEDGVSVGVAAGYNFSDQWGMELDLRFTPTEVDNGGSNDVDMLMITVGGLYHFQPTEVMNPYLSFGVGGINYDVGASSDDQDFMGYWGGGFKYAMNEDMALRLDLRHILDFRTDNSGSTQGSDKVRNQFSAMFGVTFQFGGY